MYLITDIEKIYPNWYDPNHELPKEDQQWVWENLPLPEEDEQRLKQMLNTNKKNENVIVNGCVNGGCKIPVNSELNWHKSDAITKLNKTNTDTPEYEKASYLTEIFKYWPSYDNHWLSITQNHTSRVINWVLNETVKQSIRGNIKTNPAKYFTFVIQNRTKRKVFRNTNGGIK